MTTAPPRSLRRLAIIGAAIVADLKFKINPAYLTLAGALLGMLFLSK